MSVYGEGSFYKTKNGRWVGAVMVDGKRKTVSAKTRKEALEKFRKLQALQSVERSSNITVGQAFRLYEKNKTLKYSVQRMLVQTFKHVGVLHDVELSRLRRFHVENVQGTMLSQGLSNLTVNIYVSRLLTVIRDVSASYDIEVSNNVFTVKGLTTVSERKGLSLGQIRVLVDFFQNCLKSGRVDEFCVFLCLGLFTGCRAGELLGLTWGDVDLKNKTMRINKQFRRISNDNTQGYKNILWVTDKVYLVDLKTRKSQRIINLPIIPCKILENYKKQNQQNPHNTIFKINQKTPRIMLNAWKKLQTTLNITKTDKTFYTIHELRHSTATLFLHLGVSVDVTAKILGHSTTAMTEHYQHLTQELQKEAFEKLNNI